MGILTMILVIGAIVALSSFLSKRLDVDTHTSLFIATALLAVLYVMYRIVFSSVYIFIGVVLVLVFLILKEKYDFEKLEEESQNESR